MHLRLVLSIALLGLLFTAMDSVAREDEVAATIIALERSALDRWCSGDPDGYIEIYASGVTYFDPTREERLDGLEALKEYYAPIKGVISNYRFEMINPKVQVYGETAVLTFNLVNYSRQPDGSEVVSSRWNSTEVYSRIDGEWKIIHIHWSFTSPELK